MMLNIKYPEITKKISTPENPPGSAPGKAWYITTDNIARALRPSMSGLYADFFLKLYFASGALACMGCSPFLLVQCLMVTYYPLVVACLYFFRFCTRQAESSLNFEGVGIH